MSKAFDPLCHNLVIKKLKAYGFTSQSVDLIRSFLNDRYSRVKLGTIRSECHVVVLRDLHLVHYNGTYPLLVKDRNLFMYADNHQLYVTGSDYNIVSSRLQYQGKLAMSWYRDNFPLANTEKFQCLY